MHFVFRIAAAFGLDFYTEVGDLEYLVDELDQDAFGKHHRELNAALCSLVQDYSLVSFTTLNIMVRMRLYDFLSIASTMAFFSVICDGSYFSPDIVLASPCIDSVCLHCRQDKESMASVVALIDRAIGYAFSQENMSAFGFAPALDRFSQCVHTALHSCEALIFRFILL